ncbi:VOC family protein [Prauserella muralis]|uniref:Glyoxalase n=1 Tax=Prauserella muralis TaxID=588067 RepID=A0A2V4AP71_9PSEU|nr:VOC family protein [Prauserella muralis]PXY22500.1 glyoxalase [Prauserella muralis]TWE28179.1 putative enzyme related to lactoylglutathione lyase [Prauserella muralis]
MLRGLSTTTFFADDVRAAADWYAELFGMRPYFVRPVEGPPAYVEFRLGDYLHEFGILDRRYAPEGHSREIGGALANWHVDDIEAAVERLVAHGATVHEGPVERGPGFVTASVRDPFGNLLGLMFNQHYLDVLATRGQ